MATPTTQEPLNPEPTQQPRVLIADDSRVMRLAIKKILGAGFDLVQAENGLQAWEQLCQDPTIQALVTDIEMPGLDGYELICRIRAADNEHIRDLPVITITGAEDETTKQRAFACGATDFITKPLDSIQLLARVQAYARYDQATRELTEQAEVLGEQSIADLLTGLPSRRYLLQRGEQDFALARRQGSDLVLVRIDIDGFKQHYRLLGDEGGDRLLAWAAKIMIDNVRAEDTVARIAGSEFALHANGINAQEAMTICERIRSTVAQKPFADGKNVIPVTLSMGLATLKQDNGSSLEVLLRLASQRAVHARSDGGNRVCAAIEGQSTAEVEEVTLGAPEPAVSPVAEAAANLTTIEPVSEMLEVPSLDEFSLPEVEPAEPPGEIGLGAVSGEPSPEIDALESISVEAQTDAELGIPTDTTIPPSLDLISVDKALMLLAQGQEKPLLPYLESLMRQLKPLLDLYQRARR